MRNSAEQRVSKTQGSCLVISKEPTVICDPPVSVNVDRLHNLIQKLVRIFQGYSMLLATKPVRNVSALTMIQLPQALLEACEVEVALFARIESRP